MGTNFKFKTAAEVRAAFWQHHPQFSRIGGKTQNDYPVDVRVAFVDFVDACDRDGCISRKLGDEVTL